MQIQTEGIVLRATKYSESDLILNVFTKKIGKIGVYAKNARRLKSPLMSSVQIFSHSNMILSTFDGKYRLKNADLIDNNFRISSSYEKTYLGYYFLQFAEKVAMEGQTNIRLFELLRSMLEVLKQSDKLLLQKIIFDLKMIRIFGYKPIIEQCVMCSKRENNGNFFSVEEGGRICADCLREEMYLFRLDSTSFRLMGYIFDNDIQKVLDSKISYMILKEIDRMMDRYIDYHFDNIDLSTRKMLILEEEEK
ncbi:MAG: DNA repair protein RecO [Peptostreptococcaceae bacterium]|nr:DNA repair protein RecO [Peptostreptococcaceae bacterium]